MCPSSSFGWGTEGLSTTKILKFFPFLNLISDNFVLEYQERFKKLLCSVAIKGLARWDSRIQCSIYKFPFTKSFIHLFSGSPICIQHRIGLPLQGINSPYPVSCRSLPDRAAQIRPQGRGWGFRSLPHCLG